MSERPSFWGELRERRVVRVGIVYLMAWWTTLEVAETLTSILDLPPQTPRIVFFVFLLGFPLVLGLTWAFQWTPEGLQRAKALDAGGGRTRLHMYGWIVVFALVLLGAAWITFPREAAETALTPPGELDPTAVAVLPFRVSGASTDVSYLGVGLQELLSTRLDGEIGPRSMSPAAVASLIEGQGITDATAVARRLGAGLAISGSVVGTGSHVVIEAQMTMGDEGSPVSARSEGHPDSVATLANEIVAALLSLQAGEYRESLADLTSRDPMALRDYLLGKVAWREGRWYDAVDHFGRAMDLDDTFALAGLARADAIDMAIGVGPRGGLELAWRHRERLNPRDRMYLDARRPTEPRTWAQSLAAYRRLTQELPDRAQVWYWFGEERMHHRNDLSPDWYPESQRVLRSTLDLNPRFLPALEHLLVLELEAGDPDTLRAVAGRYIESKGNVNPLVRGLALGTGRIEIDSLALTQPDVDPNWIYFAPVVPILWPHRAPDNPVSGIEQALAVLEQQQGREPLDLFSTATVAGVVYTAQAALGRPELAGRAMERAGTPNPRTVLHGAVWDATFRAEADAVAQSVRNQLARPRSLSSEQVQALTAAEVWEYMTDPDYVSTDASERIRSSVDNAQHPTNLEMEAHAQLLESWSQVRQGQPALAALDRLDELLAEGPGVLGSLDKRAFLLATSVVYSELGLPERALATLERRTYMPTATHQVEIYRRMGLYAEAAGDTARALHEYRRYLFLRGSAEPSVEAEVQSVREAVARLERGPGG